MNGTPAPKRPKGDNCEVEANLGYIDAVSQKLKKFYVLDYLVLRKEEGKTGLYMVAMICPKKLQ